MFKCPPSRNKHSNFVFHRQLKIIRMIRNECRVDLYKAQKYGRPHSFACVGRILEVCGAEEEGRDATYVVCRCAGEHLAILSMMMLVIGLREASLMLEHIYITTLFMHE